jgi:hypothetical protein
MITNRRPLVNIADFSNDRLGIIHVIGWYYSPDRQVSMPADFMID